MQNQIEFFLLAQQEIANAKKAGLPERAMEEAIKAQESISMAIAICESAS